MADHNDKLHQYANPSVYNIARQLRKSQTDAEDLLWVNLRNRKLLNLKFRRQHAFEDYVLDFYCHEIKLVIEADGAVHNDKGRQEYDNARTARLKECNIDVLRFTNNQIEKNISVVLEEIKHWVKTNRGLH